MIGKIQKYMEAKSGKFQVTLCRRQTNLFLAYESEKASYTRSIDFLQAKQWLGDNGALEAITDVKNDIEKFMEANSG